MVVTQGIAHPEPTITMSSEEGEKGSVILIKKTLRGWIRMRRAGGNQATGNKLGQ